MEMVVTLVLLVAYIVINLLVWNYAALVLPVVSGFLMILVIFLVNMTYGYFVETRGKRQLTSLFGQYVPPELVDEMSKDPDAYSLAAANREMTVLFSDVRGFTTISEGLKPEELSELMNEILSPMTRIIHKRRGTIDKYMGDAIMAFWGAPLDDPEHASNAVLAGQEIIDGLHELNEKFQGRGWPEIRVGVGINTGPMSVGNMGSEFRMAYTVLGDAVNLGSRLEGLTKGYAVDMIVSESTVRKTPDYAYRELDRVRVKGKDKPVAIFEPLCPRSSLTKAMKDEIKLYHQAVKYYRHQEWDMAELQFLNLAKSSKNSGLYKIYIDRIAHFRMNPPEPGWDGVYTHTSK
jgi:adenylate cyclase